MFRFLLRTLGFLLVAAAFATLVVDGSRSIAGSRPLFYPLGDVLAWLGGQRDVTAVVVGRWPEPVQKAVAGLLALPACVAMGASGLLLLVAGRPTAARPGFSRGRT